MQALYLKKSTKSSEHSFYIRDAIVPHMYSNWHYHKELELNLILKGSGTRFVGDHIEEFKENDLVLIGPNLPHVWKNDSKYFKGDPMLYARVINIQFLEDFAGRCFTELPEFIPIGELIKKSHLGIRFFGNTFNLVSDRIQGMVKMDGFHRIMELLHVLHILSQSQEYYCLSSEGFVKRSNQFQVDKINKVYDYILSNFTNPISVEEIADVACMNPSAFCRFFKQTMNKTFIRFLTELRVGNACKLLINSNFSIAQVCFESGFQNISNFNRQSREIMGKTPNEYRKEYESLNSIN